ncbi:hypothetical protein CL620_03335, partial [archaeon]|nr:hypothetical protein [archaeon]
MFSVKYENTASKFLKKLAVKSDVKRIFDKVDTGLDIITFGKVGYCNPCQDIVEHCDHDISKFEIISGTRIREILQQGVPFPEYLLRPEVEKTLKDYYNKTPM